VRDYFQSFEDAAAKAQKWVADIRAIFRPRRGLSPDPRRCALLVIDAQHYFCSPEGRAYLQASDAALASIARLAELFRARGGMVIFTRHGHSGPEDVGMLGKFWSDFISESEPQAEISPATGFLKDDTVIRKNTYDAFHGTELENVLRTANVDQVMLTGVMTNLCVETTARTAFCRGFEVFIVADATATTSPELHYNSLLALATGFANIYTRSELEEMWKLRS
jgi:nicotinamidase-related amidase